MHEMCLDCLSCNCLATIEVAHALYVAQACCTLPSPPLGTTLLQYMSAYVPMPMVSGYLLSAFSPSLTFRQISQLFTF